MENVDLVRFPYFVGFAWLLMVGVLYLEKKFMGFAWLLMVGVLCLEKKFVGFG